MGFLGLLLGMVICFGVAIPGIWLWLNVNPVIGALVVLSPTIITLGAQVCGHVRRRRCARRYARKRAIATISTPAPPAVSPALRAELEQSPEWWDSEFDALVRATTPRDAEYHRGHRVQESSNAALASLLTVLAERGLVTPERVPKTTLPAGPMCLDCRVPISNYSEES